MIGEIRPVGEKQHNQQPEHTKSKLDWALEHARSGLSVFPLVPNSKVPPEEMDKWQFRATTDERQVRDWWARWPEANIACFTGSSLFVIDIDPRNGGRETFEALTLTEEFPKTRVSKTPGGGHHVYYALPPHTSPRKGKLGAGVDAQTGNAYVVLPGSTINGKAYEWLNDRPMAEARPWMIERCRQGRDKSKYAGERLVEEDQEARDRAWAYLEHFAPVVNEGDRNNALVAVANALFDPGVELSTAIEYAHAWNESRCHPPLGAEEVEATVRSAMTSRALPIGCSHSLAPCFEDVSADVTDFPIRKPNENRDSTRALLDYVISEAPSAEGEKRIERLAEVLERALSFNRDASETLNALDIWNQSACEPPFADREIAVVVADGIAHREAVQAGSSPKTQSAPHSAGETDPVPAHQHKHASHSEARAPLSPTPQSKQLKREADVSGLRSFGDLLQSPDVPVAELVPGIIEKGIVQFLSAPGGNHKSRLAVQLGLCINAGVPIFERTVEQSRFVYLSCEDHADEVARRAKAITRRLQLPASAEPAVYWDRVGKDSTFGIVRESGDVDLQPFFGAFLQTLRGISGHKFVVLDGTYDVLQFAGNAKVNESSVMAAIKVLQRLCDEADATILCLWHPSQAGQERGDASGWSVAWHNKPRARLSLNAVQGNTDAVELRIEKRNNGPKGKPLTLYWSEGALLPRTAIAEEDCADAMRAAVVRVAVKAAETGAPLTLQRSSASWQIDEVEAACGWRPSNREFKDTLAQALANGELSYLRGDKRRAAGYYPADHGRAQELAIDAKRTRQSGGDDSGLRSKTREKPLQNHTQNRGQIR